MGSGLAHSLSLGPLPPVLQLPRLRSATTTTSSSPTLVVFLTAIIVVMLGTSPVTDALRPSGRASDNQRQQCSIYQCWNLYNDAQDYYQVQTDFGLNSPVPLSTEKLRNMCLVKRTFHRCLSDMYRNKSLDCHSDISYRSAYNGIESSMEQQNCSHQGEVFDPSNLPPNHGLGLPLVCTYNGPATLRYCSLFGDPHLRTFQDKFQSCSIQGVRPLLDNRYLTVQVTSKPVGYSLEPASAITELTVMIKRQVDCAADRFVTYQAEAGFLPSMFDDGSVHFGPEKSVVLEEIVENRHVEIYLRYINTTIVIRHYPLVEASFFTVSLLMPEKILNHSASRSPEEDMPSLELCSQGCPDNQQVDYLKFLASKHSPGSDGPTDKSSSGTRWLDSDDKKSVDSLNARMSFAYALEQCRSMNLVDFYLDSCVFDLMKTGEVGLSRATADAMADAIRLHPDGASSLQNRTSLEQILKDYVDANHATSSVRTINNLHYIHRTTFVLLVAMVTCAFNALWWSSIATIIVASACSSSSGYHQRGVL